MASHLCSPAASLLDDVQKNVRCVAPDFWLRFQRWMTLLGMLHGEPELHIRGLLSAAGIQLKQPLLKKLLDVTQVAIEAATDKPYKHLSDRVTTKTAGGRVTAVRTDMQIYARRACWDVSVEGALPRPEAMGAWAANAFPSGIPPAFATAYAAWWSKKATGSLSIPLPGPRAATKPFTDAHALAVLDFWRAMRAHASYRPMADAALSALSIPLSQAEVERSFSVLSNREINNRILAGAEYLRNSMMLSVNRPYVESLITEEAAALGTQIPEWTRR